MGGTGLTVTLQNERRPTAAARPTNPAPTMITVGRMGAAAGVESCCDDAVVAGMRD